MNKKNLRLSSKKLRKKNQKIMICGNHFEIPGWPYFEDSWEDYLNTLPQNKRRGNDHVAKWINGQLQFGRGPELMQNFVRLIIRPNGTGRIWLKDWKGHINIDCVGLAPRLVEYGAIRKNNKKGHRVYVMP